MFDKVSLVVLRTVRKNIGRMIQWLDDYVDD